MDEKSIEAATEAFLRNEQDSHTEADVLVFKPAIRAAIAAYRDAEIERLTAENDRNLQLLKGYAVETGELRAKLEAAERDASQLREAASAMLDKIDYNINNERLPLTYTVPWEQAVALRRAVRKDATIDSARGGE